MNKELIMALDALEKENGIDKEIMFAAIEKSLMDEYKAEFDKADNGRVELDREQAISTFILTELLLRKLLFQRTERIRKKNMYQVLILH